METPKRREVVVETHLLLKLEVEPFDNLIIYRRRKPGAKIGVEVFGGLRVCHRDTDTCDYNGNKKTTDIHTVRVSAIIVVYATKIALSTE